MAVLWIRYNGTTYSVDNTSTDNGTVVAVETWSTEAQWEAIAGQVQKLVNRSDDGRDPDCDTEDPPELPAWRPPTTAPPNTPEPPVSCGRLAPEREWHGRPSQPRPPP